MAGQWSKTKILGVVGTAATIVSLCVHFLDRPLIGSIEVIESHESMSYHSTSRPADFPHLVFDLTSQQQQARNSAPIVTYTASIKERFLLAAPYFVRPTRKQHPLNLRYVPSRADQVEIDSPFFELTDIKDQKSVLINVKRLFLLPERLSVTVTYETEKSPDVRLSQDYSLGPAFLIGGDNHEMKWAFIWVVLENKESCPIENFWAYFELPTELTEYRSYEFDGHEDILTPMTIKVIEPNNLSKLPEGPKIPFCLDLNGWDEVEADFEIRPLTADRAKIEPIGLVHVPE